MLAALYYFTGTGNALAAARMAETELQKLGYDVQLRQVYRIDPIEVDQNADLCGFFYPTHGFSPAPAMLSYLWHLPRVRKHTMAILSNTRAGLLFWSIHLPGLSGVALLLPLLILFIKGYSVRGVLPLDMPSNWLSIHPPLSPARAERIRALCEPKMQNFIRAICNGKRNFWRLFRDLPVDLAVIPISVVYSLIGRFLLAKTFVHTDRCNACGSCILYCPSQAIEKRDGYPFWTLHCESCMRCLNVCPQKAVQSSHFLLTIAIILTTLSPFYVLFHDSIPGTLLRLLDMAFIMSAMIILYRLLWPFFRRRSMGRFLAFTSLTSIWGRYLSPGIRRKDLRTVIPPDQTGRTESIKNNNI